MADATVPVWVPVATAFGGYFAKLVGDWLTAERAAIREAAKDNRARDLAEGELRDSYQRETLSKLQDALVDLNLATLDFRSKVQGAPQRWVASRGRVTVLRVQVFDKQLRDLTSAFEDVSQQSIEAPDEKDEEVTESRQKAFANVNERLGAVLRQLYHEPELLPPKEP